MAVGDTVIVERDKSGYVISKIDGTTFVKADGTVAMTNNLDMDGAKIINLLTPGDNYDAATKKYVDNNNIGLTFNIESYGAVPNDSLEASGALNVTAFNNAIAAARAVDGYVYIPTGTWYVADNIIWTHHKDAGPVKIRGAGVEKTIIKPTAAMVTSDKNIFHVLGSENPGTYQYISYFEFEDFSIIGSGYTGTSNACGIVIGKAAIGAVDYAVDSFKKMPIKNVFIENMRYGIQIFSSRQIQMDRVVIRTDIADNKCLYIYCHDGSFTGDIVGYNCEFVSDAAGTGIPISIATNGVGSEVRGIHYTDCTMYFGDIGTHIYATANGVTNDVWFTSCAWDGPYGPTVFSDAVKIENIGGFIRGVQISNPYIVNWDNCIIATCTGNYDTLSNININGGYIGYCTGYGINVYQGMGYTIHGVTFYDVDNSTSGAGVINFGNVPSTGYRDGCEYISITGNVYVQTDLNPVIDHFIVLGTGMHNYTITDNVGNVQYMSVDDQSNASESRVENNTGGTVRNYKVPTLLNSWVNYGGAYRVAQYWKDGAFIHLRGLIKDGSFAANIFTLPVGYRPNATEHFAVATNPTAWGAIEVRTDGSVYALAGSNTWLSLAGISFRLD